MATATTKVAAPAGAARGRAYGAPVVQFRVVTKRYPGGNVGLDRANFSVLRGEFVLLLGASGSGKSTVISLLIKEIEPTEGSIRIAGREMSEISRKRVPIFRRNIGVVFADFKLLPDRTVYDNVAYAIQVRGGTRRQISQRVPAVLCMTGLSTKLHHYPDQLSRDEQQRVSIARAFVNHPPLFLADEPTGDIDPEKSLDIMRLLYRINRTGTTVLIATRNRAMVEQTRRRVIELSSGRIVSDEAVDRYTSEHRMPEFA